MNNLLLFSLLLAHVLGDFLLQPKAWIEGRAALHWRSKGLWLHVLIHVVLAFLFLIIGPAKPLYIIIGLPLVIGISHLCIDVWKSYKGASLKFFILDQIAHILVLVLLCIWVDTSSRKGLMALLIWLGNPITHLKLVFFLMATFPAGLVIAKLTEKWRSQLPEHESLANAGMWIGVLERLLIMIFIVIGKFEAIGLLIAAKSLLRFADKDNASGKRTEYILIGTLLSFSITVLLGLVLSRLLLAQITQ